jgi:dethiobiotin synthetase
MRGLFVTGTDTGIGKTTICTGLIWFLRNQEIEVGVMKPFAAAEKGFSSNYRSEDTYRLALAAGSKSTDKQINPFFYKVPASPLVASKITHQKLPSLKNVVRQVLDESKKYRYMIIEGIGGIMVPISRTYTIAEFARYLGFPIIVVASAKLGSLNHILLTLEACFNHHLDVIAIVINRMPKRSDKSQRLLVSTVRQLTGIRTTFSIPEFHREPDPSSVGSILNGKWHILDALRP